MVAQALLLWSLVAVCWINSSDAAVTTTSPFGYCLKGWCKNFKGEYACCEKVKKPTITCPVDKRPTGNCDLPIDYQRGPLVGPQPCDYDHQCGGDALCCWDSCLGGHVCKYPELTITPIHPPSRPPVTKAKPITRPPPPPRRPITRKPKPVVKKPSFTQTSFTLQEINLLLQTLRAK
ncbi:unnamed protein product [Meganyctiphanes norvegica]|uniref:Uncharacterized protein n=1 Tax=Meganyctiphanes norvegica TaxID=48144 RepID=A0AAV2R347_MEGNR